MEGGAAYREEEFLKTKLSSAGRTAKVLL